MNFIELTDSNYITKGGGRICFVNPQNNNQIIKILREDNNPVSKKNKVIWYKKLLRSSSHFDDNIREASEILKLKKRNLTKHFYDYYGFVKTNYGNGLMVEIIRDYDGEISKSLKVFLENIKTSKNYNADYNKLLVALSEFFYYCYNNAILLKDITPYNLLVNIDKDNNFKIYMIDGIGASKYVILNHIRYFAKKKIIRKINKFMHKYSLFDIKEELNFVTKESLLENYYSYFRVRYYEIAYCLMISVNLNPDLIHTLTAL